MTGEDVKDWRCGSVIAGTYRLDRLIGVGGVGSVYEARHLQVDQRVAVKIIDPSLAAAIPTICTRFIREAQAAAAIRHHGVVEILDAGEEDDGTRFLVFEYLEGETLEQALKRDALSTATIVRIAMEVLDALEAAHAAGFIHRDIKPDNIFLTRDERGERKAKVLDFGVAKRKREIAGTALTRKGSLVGTLYYMSPEQAGGAAVDERADVWSLGATMFRAFVGRPPHISEHPLELLMMTTAVDVAPLLNLRPDLPLALCAVVDRALARDPEARWSTAAEMHRALALSLDEKTDRAPIPNFGFDVEKTQLAAPRGVPRRGPRTALMAISVGAAVAIPLLAFALLREPVSSSAPVEASAAIAGATAENEAIAETSTVSGAAVSEGGNKPTSSRVHPQRKKPSRARIAKPSERKRAAPAGRRPAVQKKDSEEAGPAIREYY